MVKVYLDKASFLIIHFLLAQRFDVSVHTTAHTTA